VFDERLAVAAGVTADVLTYPIPVGSSIVLVRVEFTGSNIGTYRLYFDSNLTAAYRTWFNGPMSGDWDFSCPQLGGLRVQGGTVIRVKVLHNRPYVGDFHARLEGIVLQTVP
jgi:hypothetical protein